MGKRFTDTDKYRKQFIRGLQGAYKLLWDFLYHDCNNAGIWHVDFDIAQLCLGSDMPVNKDDALKYFNDGEQRIIEISNGKKWFIPSFVEFQYGPLNQHNKAHGSVLRALVKEGISEGLIRGLQGPMDKDKDKEVYSFKEIIMYLNERSGKNFKPSSEETKRLIEARFNAGHTIEDFRIVIDHQAIKWLHDPKMREYLRPQTLFGTKFESYLNSPPSASQMGKMSSKAERALMLGKKFLEKGDAG